MIKKKFIIQNEIKRPFFSVITVVKNSDKLIERTITSIKKQKFKSFEYIIIDGLSLDNTLKKIQKYKRYVNYLISEKDNGIYFAMNKGIDLSKGEVIIFVNAGDELTMNALTHIKNKFDENPLNDFVFGTVKRHYTKSIIIKSGFNKQRLFYNFDFATSHSTGFYLKRKVFKKIGKFNTKYKCSADYDLYFRVLIKNKSIGSSTQKNKLIGIVKSGGYSSKVGFFQHLIEEARIRINNDQNIFFIIIIFLNAILKNLIKLIKI